MKKFTLKKKIIAGAAAAALVLGAGGAAFSYFTATGSGSGTATVGRRRNGPSTLDGDVTRTLYPGTGSETLGVHGRQPRHAARRRVSDVSPRSVTVDSAHALRRCVRRATSAIAVADARSAQHRCRSAPHDAARSR